MPCNWLLYKRWHQEDKQDIGVQNCFLNAEQQTVDGKGWLAIMLSISNGLHSEEVAVQALIEEAVLGVQNLGGYCQLSWHPSIQSKEEKTYSTYKCSVDRLNQGPGASHMGVRIHVCIQLSLKVTLLASSHVVRYSS